jgi:hypothetical protein
VGRLPFFMVDAGSASLAVKWRLLHYAEVVFGLIFANPLSGSRQSSQAKARLSCRPTLDFVLFSMKGLERLRPAEVCAHARGRGGLKCKRRR